MKGEPTPKDSRPNKNPVCDRDRLAIGKQKPALSVGRLSFEVSVTGCDRRALAITNRELVVH